jgi:dephospho-CoA kinase
LGALFPQAVSDGAIDRSALKALIAADSSALRRIEAAVHPLVAADRAAFIAAHLDTPLIVLDVPLLFETGAEAQVDGILVVSAPAHVQRERVLARPGMTEDHLAAILARQMPDSEKRRRATWVIETTGLDEPRAAVRKIIDTIRDCHA